MAKVKIHTAEFKRLHGRAPHAWARGIWDFARLPSGPVELAEHGQWWQARAAAVAWGEESGLTDVHLLAQQ